MRCAIAFNISLLKKIARGRLHRSAELEQTLPVGLSNSPGSSVSLARTVADHGTRLGRRASAFRQVFVATVKARCGRSCAPRSGAARATRAAALLEGVAVERAQHPVAMGVELSVVGSGRRRNAPSSPRRVASSTASSTSSTGAKLILDKDPRFGGINRCDDCHGDAVHQTSPAAAPLLDELSGWDPAGASRSGPRSRPSTRPAWARSRLRPRSARGDVARGLAEVERLGWESWCSSTGPVSAPVCTSHGHAHTPCAPWRSAWPSTRPWTVSGPR